MSRSAAQQRRRRRAEPRDAATVDALCEIIAGSRLRARSPSSAWSRTPARPRWSTPSWPTAAPLRPHLARARRRAHRPPHRAGQAAHRAAAPAPWWRRRRARSTARATPWTCSRSCPSIRRWGAWSSGAPAARARSRSAGPRPSPSCAAPPRACTRSAPSRSWSTAPSTASAAPRRASATAVVMATGGMVGDTLDEVARDHGWPRSTCCCCPAASPQTRALIAPCLEPYARAVAFDERGAATPLELTPLSARASRSPARWSAWARARSSSAAPSRRSSSTTSLRVLPPRRELSPRGARRHGAGPAAGGGAPASAAAASTLEVLTPLRVLAVTANPFRVPQPYQPKVFFSAVADAVGDRVPVFDVVQRARAALPAGAAALRRRRSPSMKGGVTVNDALQSERRRWSTAPAPRPAPSPTTSSATSTSTPPTRPSAPPCGCSASRASTRSTCRS